MSTTQPQVSVPQWLGQQLLGPLDDAAGLVRRYRELDAFRDYLADRLRLVVPIGLLVVATAVACGLAPIVAALCPRCRAGSPRAAAGPAVALSEQSSGEQHRKVLRCTKPAQVHP